MTIKVPFKLAGIAALLLLLEGNAWTADIVTAPSELPGSAQPSQVSRALTQQQNYPTNARPPVVAEQKKEAGGLGEEAKKIKFKLNNIILEGNHVYSDQQLQLIYQDKLHKTIAVADLLNIVTDITNFYRNNGYIISRAILPPQHVKNGVVRVQIIEGYIHQVNVAGNPKGAKCIVLAYGENIAKCRPLKIQRMQKYLLIANETPGTQVKAVLSPSKTETGAADLSLVTVNQPVTGYLSYDDYGTRYIGPQQITANLGLNSFISSGDSTQFTVTKTPKGGELTFVDINYTMPVNDEGVRWQMGGTRAHTHPLFVLQPSQIDGLNDNYYTSLQFPIIRSPDESLTLQTAFNYLDSEVTTFDFLLYRDHIRSLDLGGAYSFADRWLGSNAINLDLRQGLPILGYSSNYNPDTATTSRPGGRGDYTKITVQLSRLQILKGPLSAFAMFRGQWAFNPLLAAEQFTFGGSQIGRGYDVAELIGDRGVAGSLEGRYDLGLGKLLLRSLQFYIFYDVGAIWNYKKLPGAPTQLSGISTGAGVRFYMNKYISGNFMWTQTITKPVAAYELIGEGRRPRLFFSIVASLD